MAEKIATGYVEIKTEVDRLRKEMRDVKNTVNDAAKDVEKRTTSAAKSIEGGFSKAGKAILGVWAALTAARGLVNMTRGFIEAASAAEQYQTRLKVLLGSQSEGNRMFQEMANYASRVPFEYANIMESATALSGVMKGGVDEVREWMPLVGDLAAATGLTISETTGQIIRMYSAGAASADMFRERGVLAMLGFQAGVSYSAEETRQKLMEAWKDPESQFRNATDEMKETWKGTTSMLSDAWFSFSKAMGENITGELTPAVQKLTEALNWLAESMNARTSLDAYDELIKKTKQLELQRKHLTRAEETGNYSAWNQYDQNIEKLEEEIYKLKQKLGIIVAISEVPESKVETPKTPESVTKATGAEEMEATYYEGVAEQQMLKELELEKQIAEEKKKLKEDLWNWEIEKATEIDDAMLAAHDSELERIAQENEEKMALRQEYEDRKLELITNAEEMEALYHEQHMERLKQSEAKAYADIEKLKRSTAKNQIQTASALGTALLSIAGASSQEIFLATKAMDIGIAIASAHAAAARALAEVPFPANLAVSASMLQAGYWQAAAIAATAIGSVVASSGGHTGGGTYTNPTVTTNTASSKVEPVPIEEPEQRGKYNIIIEGDFYGDEYFVEMLAEKISEAVEDKDVRLVSSHSRYAEALT